MKKISIPKKRTYYTASRGDPDELLCWIPAHELGKMAREGCIRGDVPDEYPDGLEIEVSQLAFDEFGIDVGVGPQAILDLYKQYLANGALPPSEMVDGETLEGLAREAERQKRDRALGGPARSIDRSADRLPGPEMTDGDDPMTMLRSLK